MSNGTRFIAMIALAEPAAVSAAALIASIKRRYPAYQEPMERAESDRPMPGADAFVMRMGGTVLTVIPVDRPVPPGTFSVALATERAWPEARAAVDRHRAHIIVSTLNSAANPDEAIKIASDVTLATAALCGMTPAIGVYWSDANRMIQPRAFQAGADKLMKGLPPVDCWMQYLWLDGPPENGARTLVLITNGLRSFLGREIEFAPAALPPAVILERVAGTIAYLLTNGPVLDDGDTVGISTSESIRVRHLPHGQRPDIPIYELKLERLDGAPSGAPPVAERPRPSAPPDHSASRTVRGLRRPGS